MNFIKNKIKSAFVKVATIFGFGIAGGLAGGLAGGMFALILIYFVGILSLPLIIIWAIYKMVTHFFN